MLETLLGSAVREQVLLYILAMGEGYPREMARFFGSGLDSVQKQLRRLKEGGILTSRRVGRTILYSLDGSYQFIGELSQLMESALISTQASWAEELRDAMKHRENVKRGRLRYTRREYRRGP